MQLYTQKGFSSYNYRNESLKFNLDSNANSKIIYKNVNAIPKFYNKKIILNLKGNKLVCLDEDTYNENWIKNDFRYSIGLIHNGNLYTTEKEHLRLFKININDATSTVIIDSLPVHITHSKIDNNSLYFLTEVTSEDYIASFDLQNERVDWKIKQKGIIRIVYEENIILLKDSSGGFADELSCYSTNKQKEIWNISVKDLGIYRDYDSAPINYGRAESIIGFNNLIIVEIIGRRIGAFNIHTGNLEWITELKNSPFIELELYKDGKIYALCGKFYYIIDAKTGAINWEKDIEEELDKHKVFGLRTGITVTDDFIYFGKVDKNPGIVKMNKNTGEILFVYKTENEIPGHNFPLIVNDRMYIVDIKGNLLVFENN